MISQRLRGVREDGEAIEEEGFVPKLKKAFGDVGVSIEDQNGELRSTYDILHDLAGVWDQLSSKQKQYLGEKAAGNRQVKTLNAIMANWDVVEDTIQKANEATGEATEGNEKYLDSIQGRITQFKSAFSDLSRTTIDSGFIKGIVGVGTSITNAITSIGGLVPVVTTILGLLTAIKSLKIQKGVDALGKSLKNTFVSQGAGGIVGRLGLFVAGLTIAVTAISALEKKLDGFNVLESSKNKYQTSISNLEATESQLDGVRTKISSIKSLGTLSFIDQQELTKLEQTEAQLEAQYEIQKQLAEVQKEVAQADFEKLFTNYDSYTTGYAGFDFLNNIKQFFGSGFSEGSPFAFIGEGLSEFGVKVEDWGKSNKEIFVKAVDDFKKAQKEITDRNVETFNALQDNQMQMFSGAAPIIDANKEANLAARNEAFDNLSKALEIYNKYQAASQGIERNDMTEPYFQMLDQMGESINSAMQYMHDLDDALRTPFEEILKSDTFSSVSDALIELAQKGELTKDTLSDVSGVDSFIETIVTLGITAQDAARYINELYSVEQTEETGGVPNKFASIEELITNNYLASDSYKTLSTAMTEQQKVGTISMETYQKLIESDEKLANALTLTADGYALNSDAINEYIQTKTDEQRIQALLAYDEQTQKLEELKKKYEELSNATIKTDDVIAELAQNKDAQDAAERDMEAIAAYVRELDAATGALARFKAAQSSANEDANFQDSKKVYEVLKEGNKTGKRNIDDFRTATDYVLGDNWRENLDQFGGSVEKAYQHAEKVAKRYSGQKDEKTAANNFMKDVADAGFGIYDKKTGSLELNEGVTLDDMAAKMGIAKGYLTDMFKLLNTYANEGEGFTFPELFTDDEKKQVEERKKALEENEEAQEQLGDKITDVNKQIEEASKSGDEKEAQRLEQQKKRLEDSQKTLEQQHTDIESGVTTDIDTMSIDDAKKKIDELYQVITTLNGTGIDIPVTVGEEYNTLLTTFPQLRGELQNPLPPIDVKVTGDALPKLVIVDGKVKQLEGDHFVDVDVDDNGTADDVKTKVEDVENGTYAAKVDAELGNDTATGDIESIANSTYPSAKVAAESDAASINTTKAELDDLSKDRTVTYKVKYTKEAEEGEKEFGKWFENELPVADQNLTNIEEPETTQEKTWGQMWKEAWDAGAPAEETVEVPVKVEPKIEDDGGFDWIDDWNEKVAQDDTATVDIQAEASNPEEPVQQVQDAASGTPVELQFDFGDLTQLSTSMQSLIGSAEGAGVGNTSEGAGAISDLRNAYLELSTAMEKAKGVEIGDASGAEQAASEIQSAANNFMTAYNTLSTMTSSLTVEPIEVDADTSAALKKVQAIADKGVTVKVSGNTSSLASAIDAYDNRTITVNIQTNEIGENAKGTKNAAPGPSLVDEEGAELIEHVSRGTYELGTNNGPRMTNLEKGDIVHTASETKRILSRASKIGGFFRDGLNQAKTIFGGAFKTGVKGGISGLGNKSSSSKKSSSKKKSSKKSSKSSKVNMKKLQEWFEKLFDWAEIRLERLQTITNEWIFKASEAIGYTAKNSQLNNALKSVTDQINATNAAYNLYIKQADTVAQKMKLSADIVNRIKNGTIEISSYDKDTKQRIQYFQEWYNKAVQCSEALQDLKEQQLELSKQRLDNIVQYYSNYATFYENAVKRNSAQMEYNAALGVEEFASDYGVSIVNTRNQLTTLIQERDALNAELGSLVARGYIKMYSDAWFEYKDKISGLDESILNTKTDIIELQDAANKVNLTKLGYQLDQLANSASHVDEMINLHSAQAIDEYAENYKKLIDNGMEQIKNLQAQNAEYRKQQQGLDRMSAKYQELEQSIQSNITAINQMKVSQEGWNDSVYDIEIDKINKFKDQLSKTNELYERQKNLQEAIQELEKAQGQRTQRIFREGQGFVFEADQEAVKQAQESLEDVIQDELMSKMDDLIDALEEQKNNNNIYDANGNLLGTQYVIPQLDNLSEILSNYYSNPNNAPSVDAIRKLFMDELVSNSNTSNNNQASINIGDIIIQEAENGNDLANAIINQLPNALLQAIYKKS